MLKYNIINLNPHDTAEWTQDVKKNKERKQRLTRTEENIKYMLHHKIVGDFPMNKMTRLHFFKKMNEGKSTQNIRI